MNEIDISLYLVTDSTNFSTEKFLKIVEAACRGGVTCVQLREKNRNGKSFYELACCVKEITDKFKIPLIIDDRVDIALACGADGVHVGSDDLPIKEVRKILGKSKIVGATAKTVEAALKAEKDGADYIGTGAIFPTSTKVKTVLTPVSTLAEICKSVSIPVCAIGGLNSHNCDVLKSSGASGVAAVSAIMKSSDPYLATLELKEKARRALKI